MNTPLCLSRSFLSYIQAANRISAPLQPKDWLRLAVRSSVGPGNPKGSILILSLVAVAEIERVIGELLEKLESKQDPTQSHFDRCFLDAVGEVIGMVSLKSPKTAFSFGRAQKILTIYLKYAYAESRLHPAGQPVVESWRQFFHIPVDRQTLTFLYRQPLHRSLSLLPSRQLVSWKWGLDEARYMKIQNAARILSSGMDCEDPLHFEMTRIWTQPARRPAGITVIYTFVEQVRRYGKDPFAYLKSVFEKLMHDPPPEELPDLLPAAWIKAQGEPAMADDTAAA